jgi:hypothetical protein
MMTVKISDDALFAPFVHGHNRSLEESFALLVPETHIRTIQAEVLLNLRLDSLATLTAPTVGLLSRLGQWGPRGGAEASRHN